MKTETFEVMEQNEMMAVSGGARSKSARQAAVKAARKNFTKTNVKSAVGGMTAYAGVLTSAAAVGACVIATPIAVPATVAACIGLGANTAGFLCAY